MTKTLKGEKYIYVLMAIKLCELAETGETYAKVGNDSGVKGGFQFERRFRISEHDGKKYLAETKSSAHMADFTRYYEYRVYETNISIDAPTEWTH